MEIRVCKELGVNLITQRLASRIYFLIRSFQQFGGDLTRIVETKLK